MTTRRLVLVLRPTVSGIDEAAAAALTAAVGSSTIDVQIAFLDVASPSLHEVLDAALDDGIRAVVLVPVAVPRDKYLVTWTQRAVANWRETRSENRIEITLRRVSLEAAVGAAVVEGGDSGGELISASPASYRSPAWSTVDAHDRHLLLCKGPRCMAYGAGPVHRSLTGASRETSTKVTGTGCLSPCNLGPLVISNPSGTWFGRVAPEDAEALVAGKPLEHKIVREPRTCT